VRIRRPHLLTGHDVVVAVADGAGLDTRQGAACTGLAEPLAPDLFSVEHFSEPPVLLLVGAVLVDGRADVPHADRVHDHRRAGQGHLLLVDHELRDRRVAAPPLARPARRRPAVLGEGPLPPATDLEGLLGIVRKLAGMVAVQPLPELGAELPVGRSVVEVHPYLRRSLRCPASPDKHSTDAISARTRTFARTASAIRSSALPGTSITNRSRPRSSCSTRA